MHRCAGTREGAGAVASGAGRVRPSGRAFVGGHVVPLIGLLTLGLENLFGAVGVAAGLAKCKVGVDHVEIHLASRDCVDGFIGFHKEFVVTIGT